MAGDRDPEPVGIELGRRSRPGSARPTASARPPRGPPRRRGVALPAAPAIRPQFGSRPWTAALTSDDEMTARATARASASSTRARHLARDQGRRALAVGRLLAREVAGDRLDRPAELGAPRASRRATGAAPAAPDARTKTVSFVEVSPSTLSWSHVRAAAGRSSPWSVAGSTVASVRTIESIVAIRGWIIPTPLAIPVTRTERTARPSGSGSVIVVVAALTTESVVRSASAAAARPSSLGASVGATAAIPARTMSSGRRVPMIPVERRSVWLVGRPERRGEHRRRPRPGRRRRRRRSRRSRSRSSR